jgi:hypothetical protein
MAVTALAAGLVGRVVVPETGRDLGMDLVVQAQATAPEAVLAGSAAVQARGMEPDLAVVRAMDLVAEWTRIWKALSALCLLRPAHGTSWTEVAAVALRSIQTQVVFGWREARAVARRPHQQARREFPCRPLPGQVMALLASLQAARLAPGILWMGAAVAFQPTPIQAASGLKGMMAVVRRLYREVRSEFPNLAFQVWVSYTRGLAAVPTFLWTALQATRLVRGIL